MKHEILYAFAQHVMMIFHHHIYIIYVLTCGERAPGAGEDSPDACRAEGYHRRGEQETELIRSR